MARTKKVKFTTRKDGGDDQYSWALFRSDQQRPLYCGMSQSEARYEKQRAIARYEEWLAEQEAA